VRGPHGEEGPDPFFWDISFPGGRVEDEDENCLETAIREVREEVSLSLDPSHLLGRLPMVSPLIRRLRVAPYSAWGMCNPARARRSRPCPGWISLE